MRLEYSDGSLVNFLPIVSSHTFGSGMKTAKIFDWLTLLTWMQYVLLYYLPPYKIRFKNNNYTNPFIFMCAHIYKYNIKDPILWWWYKRCDEIKNLLIKTDIIS